MTVLVPFFLENAKCEWLLNFLHKHEERELAEYECFYKDSFHHPKTQHLNYILFSVRAHLPYTLYLKFHGASLVWRKYLLSCSLVTSLHRQVHKQGFDCPHEPSPSVL